MKFVGDFETATWKDDETWVWAWSTCSIDSNYSLEYGSSIESFFEWIEGKINPIIYFHNLKFDGEFILYYLNKNGFSWIKDRKERKDKTYTTLISDLGQFYQIEVFFKVGNKKVKKVTFLDSLKIIPFSVSDTAKAFKLEEKKLTLDYKKERLPNHELSEEEKAYISNDVLIVAKALKVLFDEKLEKMTIGSNALNNFKTIISKDRFSYYFPSIPKDVDTDIRKAYKGGFTYLNPYYKEKEVGTGVVLDVNSLYPSIMRSHDNLLPYGEPKFYDGKYQEDLMYPLYIQSITCSFEIKKDMIPTIQLKDKHYRFEWLPNEYVESSKNQIVNLVLTNVDLEMFLKHYEVSELKYLGGYKFKAFVGIFDNYIDYWIKIKNESTLSGNKGMRTLAKLMLNSLYGKFATSLSGKSQIPYLREDGTIGYLIGDEEERKGLYIPMGAFITAYARRKTIETSQAIKTYSIKKYGKDLYCYSDTDSIHTLLPIEELKNFCEIDDVELGKWKHESTFSKAKFVRQKCYVEIIDDKIQVTCSGLPKKCLYKKDIDKNQNKLYYITYNKDMEKVEKSFSLKDFKVGFICCGKLTFKHVKRWSYFS